MVTSKEAIEDKTKAFDSGADDYLTKPFHHKELSLRVKARLRSRRHLELPSIQLSGLDIDLQKQRVRIEGSQKLLDLTRVEFKLLVYFAQRLDHVLSRAQILEHVWPENLNISERTVDSHISHLRRKITGLGLELSAVHGSGYRLSNSKKAA